QVGFARHAAQSFVKAQAWAKGAAALEEVITEEFARTTTGQDPKKQKELRTLVLQAGRLYEQAGNLDKAQAVLERGTCFSAAGEIALRLERFAAAAELFQRTHERHAEAGSAYERQGDSNLAAEMFRLAGDTPRAASMYERAGRYAEAAECFASIGDRAKEAELL